MEFSRFNFSKTILALLTFLGAAYFYNGGSWGQNARLDVIYAFVEPGPDQFTFRIDRFVPRDGRTINTGDWSFYDGHYYSNKAPGTSLLGIPVYGILYFAEVAAGIDPGSPPIELLNVYLLNLCLSLLPLVVAVCAFYDILKDRGVSRGNATLLSLLLFFATPLFPYSTQLWGHTTAAAALIFALRNVLRQRSFTAGIYSGIAVLTDFLAAFALPGLAWILLRKSPRSLLGFVHGGLPVCALLLVYNTVCFGSPFALPTDFTNPEFVDQTRFLGLFALPSPTALWQLTFGLTRGLFISSPVLLLSVYGWYRWFKRDKRDTLLWCSLIAALAVLLVNASFNGWHGGSTVSPRYLILSLPFWILPLKELVELRRPRLQHLFVGLVLVSIANMFVIAAVSPLPPDQKAASGNGWEPHDNPLYGWVYPSFFNGRLARAKYPIRLQLLNVNWPVIAPYASWNAGQLAGLKGLQSLGPYLIVLLWLGWYAGKPRSTNAGVNGYWQKPLACSIMLLFCLDRNRVEELAKNYGQLSAGLHASLEPDMRLIYPLYPVLARVRDRILDKEGPVSLRLDVKVALPGFTQRASEILYPLVIDPKANRILQIFERDGKVQLAYRPSAGGAPW